MSDLTPTTQLLNAELPDERWVDDRYLTWLYEENPFGPAYQENADEDGVRMGHYALIPILYRDASGQIPGAYSLNAVTRTGAQRKGYFITLAQQVYKRAGEDGRQLATAVPNEKSVGAGVKHLGWRLIGRMPVRLAPPSGTGAGVETLPVTEELLTSARFEELTADLDDYPAHHLAGVWTPDALRWRLRRPQASYTLHFGRDVFAVSSRTVQKGVPAAVILKLLPRGGRRGPLSSRQVVAAACRHHRTPIALYAGWNEHVTFRGIAPPKRIQPAPLFILVRALRDGVDQDAITLGIYEFLDVDAF
jgi:hypothetical protein